LHTIRDHLPEAEAADLGAQLPTLLRGVYYDGWRPSAARHRPHGQDEILDEVRQHLGRGAPLDPERVLRAIIRVLSWHVTLGELEDIVDALPHPLARLWAEASGTPGPEAPRAKASATPRRPERSA
jgi:uncharacterized protein (DUF2267 family)